MLPREALILAGTRASGDPVALAAGVRHKALVPVGGIAMLHRVIEAVAACPSIGRIDVCIDATLDEIGATPALVAMIDGGRLAVIPPKDSPAASVAFALHHAERAFPLLVTTADHALLTPAMVTSFCGQIQDSADIAVALARASLIRAEHPDAVRTYYRFAGEGYSGCNLFMMANSRAERLVAFWQQMERHRKRPWRLVAAIGPGVLARFLLGRLNLDQAFSHLSQKTDLKIQPVLMAFAEAAIDVDKPSDVILAEAILRQRN